MKLRLATRGSKLARIQASLVQTALESADADVSLVIVSTKGDKDRLHPINQIGGRGLFVREIEEALLRGDADVAVHSGKDLPYQLADGLVIAGTPKAADCRDCLILRKGVTDPKRIGTGSPRRVWECKQFYPDAQYDSIRGNVDTRLQKLKNGAFDAILLAKAGLDRLGADLSDFDVRVFSPQEFIPSACQGIIAVECRACDRELRSLLQKISDPQTWRRFQLERRIFTRLQADCSVPLGVSVEMQGEQISLSVLFGENKITRTGTDEEELCRQIEMAL